MLPGIEMLACPNLAVPMDVMRHVVRVESSDNPYAIGVVGGRLKRQPSSLGEAIATARMLEGRGFNFSLGLAQVNRYNLGRYGLSSYAQAFDACANLLAGSRILAECRERARGDWGKAFSCYYSGNFITGFRDGYVQKVFAATARAMDARTGARVQGAVFPSAVAGIPLHQQGLRPRQSVTSRVVPVATRRAGRQAEVRGAYSTRLRYDDLEGATSAATELASPTLTAEEGFAETMPDVATGEHGTPGAAPVRTAATVVLRDAAFVF